MCSWSRFRWAGNSGAESWGGQTSTDSQHIVDALGLPSFLYKTVLFFSRAVYVLSSRAKAGSPFVFIPFWELSLCDLQRSGLTVLSPGVSQVGSVLGPSADLWAPASSCDGHYFPSACPPPCIFCQAKANTTKKVKNTTKLETSCGWICVISPQLLRVLQIETLS